MTSPSKSLGWKEKRTQSIRKLFVLGVVTISSYICFFMYLSQLSSDHFSSPLPSRQRTRVYAVDSVTCQIPSLEPFEDAVLEYLFISQPKICLGRPQLTEQRGLMLILNLTSADIFCQGDFSHCEYRTVIRQGDYKFNYSAATNFTRNTIVASEFIRVKCFCTKRKKVYTNFHAFVHSVNPPTNLSKLANESNATVLKLQEKGGKKDVKTRLNVIMIGVDSISRLNSYRQLSETRDFLLHTLGGVELKGYNKVADNTFVNIMPLLFGKYIKEIPWTPNIGKPFEEYDLMWTKYHRRGYRTIFGEDYPRNAIFNGAKLGFSKPPTDHYSRPLALAMESEKSVWWSNHHCMNNRLEVEVVMQYVQDFLRVYKSEAHFAFSFFTRISHDNINLVGSADYAFKGFFQRLRREQLLNDTLLFFFSDHGIRFGPFRETFQGKLEERLPMMYIVPPKWFPKTFPRLWENLKTNSRRLTTPFDIHETLLSALDVDEFQRNLDRIDLNSRGISLFAQVPENRTCEAATILPHWCTCHRKKTLPVNDTAVVRAAGLIVKHINLLLESAGGKCAILKLDTIEEAAAIVPNEKFLKYVGCKNQQMDILGVDYGNSTLIKNREYQLTLRTTPGWARFETTVKFMAGTGKLELLGDISRTNQYGNQSNCTSERELKRYCYCA